MANTKVELKIKCNGLSDLDVLSKSDPQVYLLIADPVTQRFDETRVKGYTEVIKDNLNPEFTTGFTIDYNFEILQLLRFIVVDVDKFGINNWREQEYIGKFDCNLGQLVSSPNQKLIGQLHNERKRTQAGTITILCEELIESKSNLKLQISAINLPQKKGFFGSISYPSTFFTISKSREDLHWVPVYSSKVKTKIQNPSWDAFEIPISKLCNGDLDRELKFDLVKVSSDGNRTIIGSAAASTNYLISNWSGSSSSLILNMKDSQMNTPKLVINEVHLVPGPPSFLDYIRSGIQISFTMAIDFTQSNGMPNNPSSLHYLDPQGRFNQYQLAIKSVGDIIAPYDHDQMFPVYGFGGRVNGVVSHCFPLNSNYNQPEVYGVDGLLNAYNNAVRNVELYGPTNFSSVINQAIHKINHSDRQKNYEILVILTDGIITDMQMTIQTIVNASNLPLSIIIIGVGNADFTMMNILDGDDNRLSFNGIKAVRDIVQFVPMRDFAIGASHYYLPKAVLEEIPEQLRSYMSINNIYPNLPPSYA